MKKFICAAAIAAVGICSTVSFGGCKTGKAYVEYKLSEGGDYYIVSGVSGDKLGLTSYEVPASYSAEEGGELLPVKEIGEGAFMQCYNLESLTLPDTVEKLGERAFVFCNFKSFTIPESVNFIGNRAFGACKSLTEITIPESVTTLETMAFYSCSSLEKAVVKADITVLEDMVFCNPVYNQGGNTYTDTALTKVYLSASITKIRDTALAGNFISDIYFAGSEAQWDDVYFFNMVDDENNSGSKKENRLEKSTVMSGGVKMHYDAEF
ncbi:MAG: leucine-rich repeat domain-containing protein [Clostridiales bacterium]|nr:leucine-rich repeat domain-containing protein [Clostridiales bacterium]